MDSVVMSCDATRMMLVVVFAAITNFTVPTKMSVGMRTDTMN